MKHPKSTVGGNIPRCTEGYSFFCSCASFSSQGLKFHIRRRGRAFIKVKDTAHREEKIYWNEVQLISLQNIE